MQAIRSKGTKIEVILAKALWRRGYHYRKNCRHILGKPDIVFRKYKLVIFCDSEFWHGKDFEVIKNRIGTNKKFWHDKIQRNIHRDQYVTQKLRLDGWCVLRFWESEIINNLDSCIEEIEKNIKESEFLHKVGDISLRGGVSLFVNSVLKLSKI